MSAPMPPGAIAIVGLAGRFPQAASLDDFWKNIAAGVESLATLSDAELDAAGVPAALRAHPHYVSRGTYVDQSEFFDAGFFRYSPREVQVIDPQQRVFLECAWEALEHAGYAVGALPESVGVYAGASMNSYVYAQLLRNPALTESVGAYQVMLGNDKDFLCTRVSYKLGLRGPSMSIQTACSTSLVAVQVACRALQRGECDMALAGGVSLTFPLGAGYLYQEGMILSPDGHCRPFDAEARGTRAGAGAGIVVLKRLAEALADGDTVHAVIRGIAINNDGDGKAGFTAPSVDGQVEVIATAQALAGVSARSIGYVEAHGTATPLGDPIEIAALTQVFRADTPDLGFCRLGSLKANLGHLDAAAGVAGLIKTVLVLQHRELPPLVNFRTPNPALELDRSPFTASATGSAWTAEGDAPRRAAISSFGIGGTNAHAVLEEAPPPVARPVPRNAQLILLSARSPEALDAATARLADHLQAHPEQALADVAFTLQHGRLAFTHRRALVAMDTAGAIAALRGPHQSGRHEGGQRPVAFLFSGQGSQYAGMGQGLYDNEPVYRAAVDRCAELLQPALGSDIRACLYAPDGAATLTETRLTQPALFVTEFALATLWQHWGVSPKAMLGHSIGEYVAAHLAGVLSLPDALIVVAARGQLMQQQAPGSMAAVHLGAAELGRWLSAEIEIAAVNAPGLCTVSGPEPAVAALLARLAGAGIEARKLHTSHAFHSAMMEPVLAAFTKVFEGVQLSPPTLPYVSNLSGTWITPQQATSPAYYAEHLRRPVQFQAGMATLAADPALHFLEVGPGTALTSLARLNLGVDGTRRAVASMRRPSDDRDDASALLESAGRLWLAGTEIDWQNLHGAPRRRVPLPTYPFERKRYAVEPTVDTLAGTAGAANAIRRSARIDDWFFAPTWSRDDSAPDPLAAGQWLVLGDDTPLTKGVCAALRALAVEPVLVERGSALERVDAAHWRVRADRAEDLAALAQELRSAGAALGGAVHLWALASEGSTPCTGEQAYATLIALAGAVPAGSPDAPTRILHFTAGAESVFDEPVRDPLAALSVGPVLVLPVETPGLQMRSIDLEWHDGGVDTVQSVPAIAAEVALAGIEPQVARRAGRRWVRRHERITLPAGTTRDLPLQAQGCYLITGGLGGIGLSIAHWLARQCGARLLLTARSALPPREAWDDWNAWLQTHPEDQRHATKIAVIRNIEAAGGAVLVAQADAADETAMASAIAAAQGRFGALHGVIHAAGISGKGRIALLASPSDARTVFAPKVQGLDVLVKLLGAEPLAFVALMSSINAAVGSPGACDYSAANAVLDAFVDSDTRPAAWRQVVAIQWGAWRDVGMASQLQVAEAMRSHWRGHLAGAIPSATGVEAFARVLRSGRQRVVVETYDVVSMGEAVRRSRPDPSAVNEVDVEAAALNSSSDLPPARGSSGATAERPILSSGFVAPDTDAEQRLVMIWTELLGVEGIGVHDDFFELGGHSLMATRVLSRIYELLGVRLALRDIFDAPTVHRLAERVTSSKTVQPGTASEDDREELEF